MAKPEMITMSMRDLDRLKTIQAVIDKILQPQVAAARLNLTERQIRRLVTNYRTSGASGLINKNRGRPSNRQLANGMESRVFTIIREHYADFGPKLACEKLSECHGINVSIETVRRIMMDGMLWTPRKLRPPKIYQPRNRRACLGELVQIDGCDHAWFEQRAPSCMLLVYVDDATSQIMQLLFTRTESTFSYFEATRNYIEQHGKPLALYSDKASVFRSNKKGATSGDGHTQFARALYELNIEGICANSSQAKGRVERTHLTLQDRLVKELRLRNINTLGAANAYAAHFIADYNRRFAKVPKSQHNVHRPVRNDEDLDLIFAWREPRCVSANLTIQYDRNLYLLSDTPEARRAAGHYIDVFHYPDGRIEPRFNGRSLPYSVYDKLSEVDQGAIVDNKRLGHVLQMAQLIQGKRDSRRSQSVPAGNGPTRKRGQKTGTKAQRALNHLDIEEALTSLR